jgi:hypothetical protein
LPGVLSVRYAMNGMFASVGRDSSAQALEGGRDASCEVRGVRRFADARVVFSHDGERAFVGDYTGRVSVWSVKDQKLAGELAVSETANAQEPQLRRKRKPRREPEPEPEPSTKVEKSP